MSLVEMYMPIKAKPKQRPQWSKYSKKPRTPKATRDFENKVATFGKAYMRKAKLTSFSEPLKVAIVVEKAVPKSWSVAKTEQALSGVIAPTTLGDVDNYAKSILDGLNGVAFEDDKYIIELYIKKTYSQQDGIRVNIDLIGTDNAY